MAKILIEPAKAKPALGQQDSLENTLKRLSQDVDNIRSGLRYKIAGKENIAQRLRDVVGQIDKECQSTRAMRSGLAELITRYEQFESENQDRVVATNASIQHQDGIDNGIDWSSIITQIIPPWLLNPLVPWTHPSAIFPLIGPLLPLLFPNITAEEAAKLTNLKIEPAKDKIEVSLKDIMHKDTEGSKYFYDFNTHKLTKVDPKDKQALEEFNKHNQEFPIDVKLLGIGGAGSISALEAEGALRGDFGGLEGSASFSKLSGDASVYVSALGIGATIGASYSLFSAEGKGYIGNEDLQAYVKGSVDVGKVEARASANVGLIDGEGKFNPSVYAGGSIEAIAGEISGSIGGKALGADVAVEGSLNVGIGAHADLGYHDGKLSVDIGASFGVGASVKLDIDVSGTIDAIGEGVGQVAETIGDGFNSFVSGTKDFFSGFF